MSLLANESYANPSTPLWVPAGGGAISGNVNITGNLGVSGTLSSTGQISGPGVTPYSIGTLPTPVTLNGPVVNITVTGAFTPVVGAEYDVQISGYWEVAGGIVPYTPAANDLARVYLSLGVPVVPDNLDGSLDIRLYPNGPVVAQNFVWTNPGKFPFKARARMTGPFTATPLILTAELDGSGTYTAATFSVTITTLDIVRVA